MAAQTQQRETVRQQKTNNERMSATFRKQPI